MEKITSRAIKAEFKRALSIAAAPQWVSAITNLFTSDQASEEYAWLEAVGALREWVDGRSAQTFDEESLTIINKHFERTIDFSLRDMRRDKFGMIQIRIADLVRRAMSHPASLLTTLIEDGEDHTCYDGQYFFDTDHSEGDSGTQDNDITVDISTLPVETAGTTTLPSVAEMQFVIATAIQQMMGFKDSAGEPMNEDLQNFVVMGPTAYHNVLHQAVFTPVQVAETQSALTALKSDYSIRAVTNPRLTWTDKIAVFSADGPIKPFIFQRETNYHLSSKAEGSDYEHDNDRHQYGIDYWGNVGYGLWQRAVLAQLT